MNAKRSRTKNYISFAIMAAVLLATMLFAASFIVKVAAETPVEYEYIYMDLAAGNVTIAGSSYSGAAYRMSGDDTFELVTITGVIQAGQVYYVYQSQGGDVAPDGYFTEDADGNKTFTLPTRAPVMINGQPWREYITNNTDVVGVIQDWNKYSGRTPTQNYISVSGAVNVTMVIDNIYTTYAEKSVTRTTSGISFHVKSQSGAASLTLKTIGENRIGAIHFATGTYTDKKLIIDEQTAGSSLTVADCDTSGNYNYWNAAIGSADSHDDSRGIVIKGGTVFAGTTPKNDCTAIGAGGNGYGDVRIEGGTVTAVTSSSGTAIGGGIGKTAKGGQAYVEITGGTIYAYNFSCSSGGYSQQSVAYIPAAAIGGGSSARETCNSSTIKITGGRVFAQSVGGTAIGGGSSADNSGGSSTVTIGGDAYVEAKSIAGTIAGNAVPAGVAIGGGTGGKAAGKNGGNVTLNISGSPTVIVGSIGGGKTISPSGKIGSATVNISGGKIQGQIIMAAGSSTNCSFKMSDGTIDNSKRETSFVFLQENGGAIYMDDPAGTATISGGTIENCSAQNGGAIYMTAGKVTISDTAIIRDCSATQNGGAIYMGGGELTMTNGELLDNSAVNGGSIYLADGTISVSGGTLKGNIATEKGGVAYLGGGTLTIGGTASVMNNQSQNGGAAYLQNGTMHISGGTLSDNTAEQNGGAAYLAGGTLTVSETALIIGNGAQNGGAAYLGGGEMQISGGTLSGNTAEQNGGAAYLAGNGIMRISGGTISGNAATQNGGAAYLAGGTLTISEPVVTLADEPAQISGALITDNSAQNGGAAYLQSGTMTISGGKLSGNKADENGGAAYLGGGSLHIGGTATLTDNHALAGDGGAAYVSGGNVTIDGTCVISQNTAAINGGGICVSNGNVTMSAGTFDDNTATAGAGGAIYVSADTGNVQVTVTGGTISNNDANTNGGALSVVGDKNNLNANIAVTVGCNVKHEAGEDGVVVPVPGDHNHASCPIIQNNTADVEGGAIYVTGAPKKANLTVHCLVETGNHVGESFDGKQKSNFLKIDGGSILLSSDDADGNPGYGNIQIANTVHVTGGQVDLRGSMDDILILENMTIDILVAQDDYFDDNRDAGDNYYKLEYFENFQGTGRYTAYQLKKDEPNRILPAMYSHEGYTLDGWNAEGHNKTFKVDQSYMGENGSLKLYAVWRLNGYLVTFNANVPLGETSWGTTESVTGQFNKKIALPDCSYVRPGYNFVWWERTLEDGTKIYYRYDEEVVNLSIVDGAVIEMKAIWEQCNHEKRDGDNAAETPIPGVEYSYQSSGNCITLSCSCHGYTETATVRAQGAVYDKGAHDATVQFSHADWEGCTLTYQYKKHGEDQQFSPFEGQPTNAGVYIATITYEGETASVTYVIGKAEQSVPVKPTYQVTKDDTFTTLIIQNASEFKACTVSGEMPVIRLVYFGSEDPTPQDWTSEYNTRFVFDIAFTNYYVEICYPETDNYKQSVIVVSDATYYIGNVEIIVDAAIGIICTPIEDKDNETETHKGLTVNVGAADGYYLTSAFSFVAQSDIGDAALNVVTVEDKAKYRIFNIPDNSKLTITVTGASRGVIITSAITAGERFEIVTETQATVRQDAAYTAYFTLNYFDPEIYSELSLDLGASMPKGTSVIMMDLSMNQYWYYVMAEEMRTVPLSAMTEMGGSEKYTSDQNRRAYVFVVSYANTETLPQAESLSLKLTAATSDANAPFTCPALSLTLTAVSYHLEQNGQQAGLDQHLTFYAKESGATAIVLTPTADSNLPIDAYFKLVEGQYETNYYQKGGMFIIPLKNAQGQITLTLCSGLFPQAGDAYEFDVQYLLSQTTAASAPLNGKDYAANDMTLTFTKSATPSPSICLRTDRRVYSTQEILDISVEGKNLAGCSVQAVWMYKNAQGTYSLTGWDRILEFDGDTATEQINLTGYDEHKNYCLKLIVSDSAGQALFEVPYYFIVQ